MSHSWFLRVGILTLSNNVQATCFCKEKSGPPLACARVAAVPRERPVFSQTARPTVCEKQDRKGKASPEGSTPKRLPPAKGFFQLVYSPYP